MSLFHLLRQRLGESEKSSNETETVRNITRALDRMEPDRAKFIAAFAYLLGRVARADLNVSREETQVMERIIVERGGLPEEQAVLVVQIAKAQNILLGGTENYLVSREFKEATTYAERIALLDCLFAVAAADESISTIEDNEVSQIADELRIEHRDFISIRLKYRDYLAVLKDSQSFRKH
jgi:uncharacterized tellurite resistance protein B-like protein